jgi:hypothetical protein
MLCRSPLGGMGRPVPGGAIRSRGAGQRREGLLFLRFIKSAIPPPPHKSVSHWNHIPHQYLESQARGAKLPQEFGAYS